MMNLFNTKWNILNFEFLKSLMTLVIPKMMCFKTMTELMTYCLCKLFCMYASIGIFMFACGNTCVSVPACIHVEARD